MEYLGKRRLLRVILLMTMAPASVAIGLVLLKSVTATFILFHGVVCLSVPLLDVLLQRRSLALFLRETGFKDFRSNILQAVLIGLVMLGAVFLFFSALQSSIWNISGIAELLDRWGINRRNPVPFILMMILGNAFLEEFFWRGYITVKLTGLMGKRAVILVSSAFYASYHSLTTGVLFSVPYAIVSTVSIFAAGVLWSSIRLRSGSLIFPLVTHLFVDLGIMLIYMKYLL